MKASRLTIWAVAAVAAVGMTTAAVTVANASSGPDDVLTQEEVGRELAAETTSPPASPSADVTESPSPPQGDASHTQTVRSVAGQLTVSCDGDSARLETWSPNPGYRVDDVEHGPDARVAVEFESDSHDDVVVLVQCEGGEPTAVEDVDPDDHGGDRDDNDDDDHDDQDDD